MDNDKFGVSIKGVLKQNGKYLLRKNERGEYELLGGRLEKDDLCPQIRLKTEFIEESGITINVGEFCEPWLYEIGYSNVMIIPYKCEAIDIPETLYDEDGGELEWVDENLISSIFMPQGYKDTIWGNIPHKSYSIPAKKYFKIIPNYVERNYFVKVRVYQKEQLIWEGALNHFNSPRDFIYKNLGENYKDCMLDSQEISIDRENDTIILNYIIK
ncbi:MAG TPA: hypothetical protein H9909_09865 [Candidatus Mediterraneibacter norfolkensis]|nr:hypothetical protein [Candidatus Mediterraneibacter norfolkensis]